MTLPKYVFLNSPEFPGIEFILSTKSPFNIYRIYQFHSKDDMEIFCSKHTIFGNFTNEGYNIVFASAGTLTNFNLKPVDKLQDPVVLEYQMPELKQWYFDNRIKGNETRMKKYKN